MPPFTVQLDANAPVTLADAKGYAKAKLNASPEDDLLHLLINNAMDNIEKEINLEIVSRGTITEQHDILELKQFEIWLLQRPVHNFVSVHNDTARQFAAQSEIPSSEYIFDDERGKLMRMGSGSAVPTTFLAGYGVVQVVYEAGYRNPATNLPASADAIPNGLRACVLETIASYYYHITEQGFNVTGNSDDQGNRTFISFDFIPKTIMRKLEQFKIKRIGRIRARRVSLT